jgi:hypothetical protein
MQSENNKFGTNDNIYMRNNNPIPNPVPYTVRTENSPLGNLPLDVSKDLNEFSKFFVTIGFDNFRNIHCCEKCFPSFDFMIYGELPDGDKKLIFTCSKHNQFCKCCDNCIITYFCLCDYVCCNSIVFQMDYRRNNKTFYTQGLNIQRGCYCCKCHCCSCCCCCGCCPPSILNLRENVDPDNPDFNVGIKKGRTSKYGCLLTDKVVSYFSQEGMKGPSIRAGCCTGCICCDCSDIIMDIEDGNGGSIGKILIPNGCNSEKVKGMCCHLPRRYYEINISQNITSEQKFQIIADVVHFSLAY